MRKASRLYGFCLTLLLTVVLKETANSLVGTLRTEPNCEVSTPFLRGFPSNSLIGAHLNRLRQEEIAESDTSFTLCSLEVIYVIFQNQIPTYPLQRPVA
jgi:hypothetical protein